MEEKDYREYLSYDNGRGLLIKQEDVFVLKEYGIDVDNFSNLNDLLIRISQLMEDLEDELEELEGVVAHLMEMRYYYEFRK